MDIGALLKRAREYLTPQNLLVMLAVCSFAPYAFTAVAVVFTVILIFITPEFQRGLFHFRGAFLIPAFCAYALICAFFNKNIAGVACAVLFFVIMMIFCFSRTFITEKSFFACLDGACIMVIPATVYAFVEVLTYDGTSKYVYRCQSYFFNANYFGALMAAAVIICAYKIVDSHGKAYFYYFIAALALIDIYLSGSLFAIIEIIVGVAVYLLFSKHYRLFCLMIICGSLGLIAITKIPQILPRLSEATRTTGQRVQIWGISIREILNHPIFGRGFTTYNSIKDLYVGSYQTVHCHNLFLDSMLNFGAVGCVILISMFYFIYRRVVLCLIKDRTSVVITLIVSITAAVLAHSFTDITFFWIQTGVFYTVILGGVGCEERRLDVKNDLLIKGRYRI